VKREKDASDVLTFSGAWEVNKNNEIIYRYETAALRRKTSRAHTLVFRGHWDIKEKLRISYEMAAGSDSVFDFKTAAGVFKKDYIEYEMGIGLSRRARPLSRTVTLSGGWNFKKGRGFVFEFECGGEGRAIAFGADAKLTGSDTVSVRLKSRLDGRDMGGSLEFSRKIFKGEGETFLRLLRSEKEASVYAGAAWRW
jgi:hypothetical protein